MKSKPVKFSDAANPIFHLATPDSKGQPLCGEQSPYAPIGSYVEHLDTSSGDVRWVREVFGSNGKPVDPCPQCFSAYPCIPKQITPFSINVNVQFDPDKESVGYRVTAKGEACIGDKREPIKAFPGLAFTSARWFYGLNFRIEIDANSIVPWVNNANKGEGKRP